MRATHKNNAIARIENNFIFNAQYQLTAREQKIMLFLISNINPQEKNFQVQVISLKDLKAVIMKNRSGSFYSEMMEFSVRISKKQIIYDSDIKMESKRLKGIINWFQSITPVYNESGDLCLEFEFSNKLKPFLLQLKEYTQINYLETMPLGSSFSIRMYQVFRAYRDKMRKHQKRSKLYYELGSLRNVLGVADKYKDWRKFNERVLKKIEGEINEHTSVRVKVHKRTQGRKIIGVEFEIWEKGSGHTSRPGALTFAQEKASKLLVKYGIEEGIGFQIISKIKGSEIIGFEDWYINEVIRIFEIKTTAETVEQKAGTLVNWFLKKKVFEQGDMFAKIMERLQERKKQVRESDNKAWRNREIAKGISAEEFRSTINQKK